MNIIFFEFNSSIEVEEVQKFVRKFEVVNNNIVETISLKVSKDNKTFLVLFIKNDGKLHISTTFKKSMSHEKTNISEVMTDIIPKVSLYTFKSDEEQIEIYCNIEPLIKEVES